MVRPVGEGRAVLGRTPPVRHAPAPTTSHLGKALTYFIDFFKDNIIIFVLKPLQQFLHKLLVPVILLLTIHLIIVCLT